MVEDVGLQPPQRGARVEAQLLDQHRPRAAQDRERVGLAARAIEGEREQAPGVLAPRVLGDMGVEVRDRLHRQAARQARLGQPLDAAQP